MAKTDIPMLLVKQKTKDYIKSLGKLNVASDYLVALNEVVADEIKEAVLRTEANKRKTVSGKDVTGETLGTVTPLVIQSKVREYIKTLGSYNVASDFIDALNFKVAKLVEATVNRAIANNRKTVQGKDC